MISFEIVMTTRILLRRGDITTLEVDAVVNSVNSDLILGAGVSGAILRAAGPALQQECTKIGSIPLGEACVTPGGGHLRVKHIIHAGAIPLGTWATKESIRNATANALKRAKELEAKTLALPAIGTGVGSFPIDRCAEIMLDETRKHVEAGTTLETIWFVLLEETTYAFFDEVFTAAGVEDFRDETAPAPSAIGSQAHRPDEPE